MAHFGCTNCGATGQGKIPNKCPNCNSRANVGNKAVITVVNSAGLDAFRARYGNKAQKVVEPKPFSGFRHGAKKPNR